MTNTEAIKTLRANYPDACFEQLREAVDAAIKALKTQDASGDVISRQAAIEIIQSMYPGMPRVPGMRKDWQKRYEPYIRMENAIRELPSAQPEREECEEREKGLCPYYAG